MTVLLVALGGALGATLRYLTGLVVASPRGTLAVNVTGSFVLGVVLGLPLAPWLIALLGTGFCGALTTYSTFGWEILNLARGGRSFDAAAYALVSVVAGLGAATLGFLVSAVLHG